MDDLDEVAEKIKVNLKGVLGYLKVIMPKESQKFIPLLPNMEVSPAPKATTPENAVGKRRSLLQMILSIFGIPYNAFFPEDSQHTMVAYKAVREIGNNVIQNLQNDLTKFLCYIYALIFKDEMSDDVDKNYVEKELSQGKVLTADEIIAIQNKYEIEISFNNNPHLDFDVLIQLKNSGCIDEETFRMFALKIHNIPLKYMSKEYKQPIDKPLNNETTKDDKLKDDKSEDKKQEEKQ